MSEKNRVISFNGRNSTQVKIQFGPFNGRMDRILESSYGNMSAHKKFQLKAKN